MIGRQVFWVKIVLLGKYYAQESHHFSLYKSMPFGACLESSGRDNAWSSQFRGCSATCQWRRNYLNRNQAIGKRLATFQSQGGACSSQGVECDDCG